jgi:2'-5' RNA ligase
MGKKKEVRPEGITRRPVILQRNAYSVALTFPGELEILLSKLREPFRAHIQHAFSPHVTIVYALKPTESIDIVAAKLEGIAKTARPFKLVLEGIEYFQTINNVAYIAVKNPEPVKSLMHEIVLAIRKDVTGYYAGETYHPDHLIAHMTIGEKIPAHVFPEVKKHFAGIKIAREMVVNDFVLAGESGGLWQELKRFKFGGNT